MNRFLLTVSIVLSGILSASAANNITTTTKFTGSEIRNIKISSMCKAVIRQGLTTGATVSVSEDYQDKLIFDLTDDGTLTIEISEDTMIWGKKFRLTADITCTTLEKLNVKGMAQVTIEGPVVTENLDICLSGLAKVNFLNHLAVKNNLTLESNGISELKAKSIAVPESCLKLSGISKVNIEGKTDELDLTMSEYSSLKNIRFHTTRLKNYYVDSYSEVLITFDGLKLTKKRIQP